MLLGVLSRTVSGKRNILGESEQSAFGGAVVCLLEESNARVNEREREDGRSE